MLEANADPHSEPGFDSQTRKGTPGALGSDAHGSEVVEGIDGVQSRHGDDVPEMRGVVKASTEQVGVEQDRQHLVADGEDGASELCLQRPVVDVVTGRRRSSVGQDCACEWGWTR